ncbi:MAG TPA: Zn-ribbon domain-containing OB-fold protein [Desulfatiglandales bacterium]|nr:Zn-ribbon domain-containing OB-fold protein [Desulfatiglandales bacterium]
MGERPFSDISYEQYLNEEKLMGSRCKKCKALFVPPRSICVKCYSSEMEWVEMNGTGQLAAFTCITVAPPFMMAQGYDRKHPYCSGVVELEEGARVDARIEGVDATRPEDIKIGMPLRVKFLHQVEGENRETYLAFEPR